MAEAAENNPAPRGFSDQQAVDAILGVGPEDKKAPEGQASESQDQGVAEPQKKPQAIGSQAEAPPVESEEQAVDSLMDEEGEDAEVEQEADPEETLEADDGEAEHSEESDEEAEVRPLRADDVIFHDTEGNPVTAEEAHKGYLRQSDYTKKTQELAQQREQLGQLYQAREQERQVLAEHINMALSVVEPKLAELQKVDWDRLAIDDPHQYARKRAEFDAASRRYEQLQQAGQQTLQQQTEEQKAQRQKFLAAQHKVAQKLIPELADPKQAPQAVARLKAYMTRAAGLSDQEAGNVADARILNLVNKAMKYDLMQAQAKQARDKKVKTAPRKGLKGGSPQTQAQRQEAARQEKTARLRKSGKIADAVDLILTGPS